MISSWGDDISDLSAQRITADGDPVGSSIPVGSHIAALDGGGFVSIGYLYREDWPVSRRHLQAQRYDADGEPTGAPVLVTTRLGYLNMPFSVKGLPGGGFITAWRHENNGPDRYDSDIVAQIIGPNGRKIGGEMTITHLFGDDTDPEIAVLADGKIAITWQTQINAGNADVRMTLLGAQGEVLVSEALVNTQTAFGQHVPSISALANGGFVIAWRDGARTYQLDESDPAALKAQIFDGSGTKVGDELLVADAARGMSRADVLGLSEGGFIVSWRDLTTREIDAQLFNDLGRKAGGPTHVMTSDGPAIYNGDLIETSQGQLGFVVTQTGTDWKSRVEVHYWSVAPDLVIAGTARNDALSGKSENDVLTGLAGDDRLDGGAGADEMAGGTGNDSYWVDSVFDKVIERAGEGIDTVWSSVDFDLAGLEVENLRLTASSASVGSGNALANRISGNAGGNLLAGVGGNDVLNGDAGNDTLVGGSGNDILDGGAGTDTARYDDAAGAVAVRLSASEAQNTGGAGIDKLFGIENLVGSRFNDVLQGDGANNRLDGGNGDDILEGGAGSDLLNGGAGIDTASYAGAVAGTKVSLAIATGQDTAGAGQDRLIGIENLLGSAFNDILRGNDGANALNGNNGDDLLLAYAGSDMMAGGAGRDRLYGGDGNDTVDGGAGDDQIAGEAGRDILSGGAGADRFLFSRLSDSGTAPSVRDRITDFSHAEGDRIDLSGIDAVAGGKDDAFVFVAGGAFTGASGQLIVTGGGSSRFVQLDVDGDRVADFAIQIDDRTTLQAADFVL